MGKVEGHPGRSLLARWRNPEQCANLVQYGVGKLLRYFIFVLPETYPLFKVENVASVGICFSERGIHLLLSFKELFAGRMK